MKNPLILLAAALALLVAGCSSSGKKRGESDPVLDDYERQEALDRGTDLFSDRRRQRRLAQLDAQQLYLRARDLLDGSDFRAAIEAYDDLSKRHPFSDFATQGEVERSYALYRNFEYERAQSAVDRFLREHPRYAAVDYLYYLRGLINFEREGSSLSIMPIDETKSDVSSQRRAFDDFALLLQRFPDSRYAGDAYERMVYVRNRSAAHELHVVDFYIRRGAYVAAAKRAEQIIAQYPQTLASYRALAMLAECYEEAGLSRQAEDTRRLLDAQDAGLVRRAVGTSISDLGEISVALASKDSAKPAKKAGKAEIPPVPEVSEAKAEALLSDEAVEAEGAAAAAESDDVAVKAKKAEAAAREFDQPNSAEPAQDDAASGSVLQVFFGSEKQDADDTETESP